MKFLDSTNKVEGNSYIFIFRHSEKTEDENGLTENGKKIAYEVGKKILDKFGKINRIKSSPLNRCLVTAQSMMAGNKNQDITIFQSKNLGKPGVFIADTSLSGKWFDQFSAQGVVAKQFRKESMPGIRDIDEGTKLLMTEEVMQDLDQEWLNVYITHDAILATFTACLTDKEINVSNWFGFLDGICISRDKNNNYYLHRDDDEYDITQKLQSLKLVESNYPTLKL